MTKRVYGVPFDMVAKGTRDVRELTEGKVYRAIYGYEKGIFEDRPFVTVIDDNGNELSCHARRFEEVTNG